MPHKVNARLSERVNGLTSVLKGNVVMIQELVGNQWNEGDVSCSVVRRVALPDSLYAMDAILDTMHRIIRDLVLQRDVIQQEVDEYLPFLATTKMLSEAVKNGMGREDAHARIKKLSLMANENLRKHGRNNLFELVSADSKFRFTSDFLKAIQDPSLMIVGAVRQTRDVIKNALEVSKAFPDSSKYIPVDSI
jgi:adenylosuccinate lyase